MSKKSTVKTHTLKDLYMEYLMAQEDWYFAAWQACHEVGKRKASRRYFNMMQQFLDEIEFVATERPAVVSRYIRQNTDAPAIRRFVQEWMTA